MAALGYAYNPMEHEPSTGKPDPFPAGEVDFMVLNTDVKPAKGANLRSDGTYDRSFMWLENEVQSGPNAGRKWWDQITLTNPNPEAERIGAEQLSALCRSVGHLQAIQNSDVLHGRSGKAEVDIEPAGKDAKTGKSFSAKNVTKRYIVPGSEGGKAAPAASGNAASAPAPAAPANKPWLKK